MALATQCPHCHTTFRVAQDQLKLRAGLVRCGNCKEVFNGIEHLLPAVAPSQPPAAHGNPAAETAAVRALGSDQDDAAARRVALDNARSLQETAPEPEAATGFIDFFDLIKTPPEPAPEPESAFPGNAGAENDPLQRMTLIDLKQDDANLEEVEDPQPEPMTEREASSPKPHSAGESPHAPDPLDLAIENLQRKPTRSSRPRKAPKDLEPDDSDEPGFLKSGRRRQRVGRAMRIAIGLGSFVLLIGALGQGAYIMRNQIAARLPESMPFLAQACAVIGCSIGLPAQIDTIAIESSELQTLAAKDNFLLSTLLRNQSRTAQEWPNIELTLNDASDKVIARRVFAPRDYLPPGMDWSKGMAPTSEQLVKIYFGLAQLKASGYRVYLFYP